jgi:hypothetical protein
MENLVPKIPVWFRLYGGNLKVGFKSSTKHTLKVDCLLSLEVR